MKYKKNSGKEKLREKFHSQRVAQKKCSCVRKNIPAKEMLTKIPHPHSFSNGPSFSGSRELMGRVSRLRLISKYETVLIVLEILVHEL